MEAESQIFTVSPVDTRRVTSSMTPSGELHNMKINFQKFFFPETDFLPSSYTGFGGLT